MENVLDCGFQLLFCQIMWSSADPQSSRPTSLHMDTNTHTSENRQRKTKLQVVCLDTVNLVLT
jgi:hypothetical protein